MPAALKNYFKSLTLTNAIVYATLAAIIIGGAWFFFFKSTGEGRQVLIVAPGEFVQEVSVSGKVVAAQEVDLSFRETGHVESVRVVVGQRISTGQTLATLESGTLAADLRAAQVDLQQARKEQDTTVAGAYRQLLSESLTAVPDSSSYAAQPPLITGLYDGSEGVYKIRVNRTQPGFHELRTFDLETTQPVDILEDEPTVLGTRGLFISFPDNLNEYDDTVWYVTIPNAKSSSYLANYNAYQEALRVRDKTLAAAQSEVDSINTQIAERALRAPFAGVVTAVEVDPGAISSPNEPVISLIGADTLQIESFVPEINVSLLRVGEPAVVTLDAYGAEVPFSAAVAAIDPAETVRDGVSTYRTILEFQEQDERIKSGMTANVVITADRREGVIAIPQGLIISHDGKKFVRVLVNGQTVEKEVTTGRVSSLGSVEILSGLFAGDIVILSD